MKAVPALKHNSPFTIGICASDSGANFHPLLSLVRTQEYGPDFSLQRIVIVASGCPAELVRSAERTVEADPRVTLIVEPERRGKAEAINKILAKTEGEFLVLVNSDASPERGAISSLLSVAASDQTVGVVSAMPVIEAGGGLTYALVDLMWTTHNECSLALNHMNLSNHASDELVVFRSKAVAKLPEDLVNDGAFMAATARRRGYSVKFCAPARVRIETPDRVSDLIGQRRRILFGHAQVWRNLGSPPRTIESLLVFTPLLGLRLLVRTIARHPRFLFVLPVAALSEFAASVLATWDCLRSTRRHIVWRRFT